MRILSVAGSGLLRHCNESVFESLKFAFPDHGWNVWRLGVVKMGWWKDAANQRSFLDAVASDLNVHTLEDWYTVSREDLMRVGGRTLLTYYSFSIPKAIVSAFPEHKWHEWRFYSLAAAFWRRKANSSDIEDITMFIDSISKSPPLQINSLEDWYRVSRHDILSSGAAGAVSAYGGLASLLSRIYPQHPWDLARFQTKNKAATQRLIVNFLKDLLPNYVVEEVARLALSSVSGKHIEIDVLVPGLRLGLEYQGEQHYIDSRRVGQQAVQAETDESKSLACARSGITLIEVPYTWDLTAKTLVDLILRERPDIHSKIDDSALQRLSAGPRYKSQRRTRIASSLTT